MADPHCYDKKPVKVELEPGSYWWCSCGKSSHQPFCDGSHKGMRLAPVKLVVEEPKTFFLCNCKATKNAPFCDGSHKGV